jgi:integrase
LALQEEVTKSFDRKYGLKRNKHPVKLRDFVVMFIENYSKVNKRSWKDDFYRLRKCNDFFGDIYLHEVTPLEIEKFKSVKLAEGLTKTSVNHYLKILKRLFNIAINWEYATDNPVRRVALYSEKDALKERILSKEEEARILQASADHIRPILIVALNTGMRRGEILSLKWEQVDFQAKEIKILKTKSGKPRIVDINSLLLKALTNLKGEIKGSQYVFLNPKTGKPYTKLHRSFKHACRRADIKNLRFHDLRHTFASRLIEKGVDIIRVKEILGHSSVKITERYTHSNQEERKKAVELLCDDLPKTGQKWGELLHGCDTGKSKRESVLVSSLFSFN